LARIERIYHGIRERGPMFRLADLQEERGAP
jgi:hypothetical protein